VEHAKEDRPPDVLEEQAWGSEAPRGFLKRVAAPGMSLIAEFKRRSPSAGVIREEDDPGQVAAAYEAGGARALSVLTEPEFFAGSDDDVRVAREESSLPILRKDFVVDPYQVVEARAAGADAVLLIVAALEPQELRLLISEAERWGLDALVEVHDGADLKTALEAEARLVGVNQRNLRTFEVDRGLAERMRPEIPDEVVVVAESGISTADEVQALMRAGIDAVLVGASLMRSEDPARAAAELLATER
jgi:indole-3-glycerol phosphate synthase